MESEVIIIKEKLDKLERDVEMIKEILLPEGELTNWAKKELEEARKRKIKIPHDEVKKMILGK